ncbi:uncharacterized protein LOC126741611 isoform X2 [Anthonomus grandis grandis]|uniref:uncharacterized protein LOC126741611 isoform X2 n=1 Tax=Anthonomus grandis grandis TaxID=2921223 RepID=UPI0021658755|nr:uncharacterized protein LOC126741611 isoform X2 [Anthonomus grandis grandis]
MNHSWKPQHQIKSRTQLIMSRAAARKRPHSPDPKYVGDGVEKENIYYTSVIDGSSSKKPINNDSDKVLDISKPISKNCLDTVTQDQQYLHLGILKDNQNTDGSWLKPVLNHGLDNVLPNSIFSNTEESVANETISKVPQNSIKMFGDYAEQSLNDISFRSSIFNLSDNEKTAADERTEKSFDLDENEEIRVNENLKVGVNPTENEKITVRENTEVVNISENIPAFSYPITKDGTTSKRKKFHKSVDQRKQANQEKKRNFLMLKNHVITSAPKNVSKI